MKDEDHVKAFAMSNILWRLIVTDLRDRAVLTGRNPTVEMTRICDRIHGDGDEIIVGMDEMSRHLRIRIDMVDSDYVEMSAARAAGDQTIEDIETFLGEQP